MLTTILLAIIVLVLAARGAHWLIKYHVQALNTEREKRNNNYLAAKLLAETLVTSGVARGDPRLPPELAATQALLMEGLARKLEGPYGLRPYGLRPAGSRWLP